MMRKCQVRFLGEGGTVTCPLLPDKKFSRSVEYKTTGWKLLNPKTINFSDNKNIGTLKLKGTWDLGVFKQSDIKRVRLIKRADGYYCQFVLACEVKFALAGVS